jgi:CCR4-NOT complex subunit CAF16
MLFAGGLTSEVPELQQGRKLLRVVERWLRSDLEISRQQEAADPSLRAKRPGALIPRTTPLMPTKHMMFFRG